MTAVETRGLQDNRDRHPILSRRANQTHDIRRFRKRLKGKDRGRDGFHRAPTTIGLRQFQ